MRFLLHFKNCWKKIIFRPAGFCDSKMRANDVYEVIKSSVKVNVAFLDKVIVVYAGRMGEEQVKAITQYMDWLDFKKYAEKFVFIYNKSEDLNDFQKLKNVTHMCSVLGADPNTKCTQLVKDENTGEFYEKSIKMSLALGFPPRASYATIENDRKAFLAAAMAPEPDLRIPVDKSICTIL